MPSRCDRASGCGLVCDKYIVCDNCDITICSECVVNQLHARVSMSHVDKCRKCGEIIRRVQMVDMCGIDVLENIRYKLATKERWIYVDRRDTVSEDIAKIAKKLDDLPKNLKRRSCIFFDLTQSVHDLAMYVREREQMLDEDLHPTEKSLREDDGFYTQWSDLMIALANTVEYEIETIHRNYKLNNYKKEIQNGKVVVEDIKQDIKKMLSNIQRSVDKVKRETLKLLVAYPSVKCKLIEDVAHGHFHRELPTPADFDDLDFPCERTVEDDDDDDDADTPFWMLEIGCVQMNMKRKMDDTSNFTDTKRQRMDVIVISDDEEDF